MTQESSWRKKSSTATPGRTGSAWKLGKGRETTTYVRRKRQQKTSEVATKRKKSFPVLILPHSGPHQDCTNNKVQLKHYYYPLLTLKISTLSILPHGAHHPQHQAQTKQHYFLFRYVSELALPGGLPYTSLDLGS